MSDQRTVAVGLTAQVGNYLTGLRAAGAETRKLAEEMTSARAKNEAHNQALTKLGIGFLGVGAAAAAGLALVVKASSDYGAKMAQLQTLSHASAGEMQKLSDAAMTQGQAFGYSATQVADAEIELTKAGIGVQAQLGGALKGALELAAAGQMDVGQATEIATVAMTQFKLKAGDIPHVADLLSAGADKALGSVADLGEGLKNGGLQAHNMGLTIDDTVGTLAAFANQGILGAEAGTQLRSMFLRLQNPVAGAKKTMQEYGITVNDASGKFVGITKFAGELHDKLGGLSQATRNAALATMFGSHAIVGATALYQYGAKGIGDWIKSVNDTGFASAQAAGKMNSLQGDVTKLSAVFQTDLIKSGQNASGMLRSLVQDATGVVKFFGDLPGPVQATGLVVGTLAAGVGLLGGAVLLAVPKIAEFKLALDGLKLSGGQLAGTIGKGGVILAGVADIAAGFAALGQVGTATSQQIAQSAVSIQQKWAGVDKLFGSAGSSIDSGKGLKAALDELGNGGAWSSSGSAKIIDGMTLGLSHLSDVFKSNEGTFDAMGQQLAGLAKQNYGQAAQGFDLLVTKFHLSGDEISNLLRVMPAYRTELADLAQKAGITASDQNLLNLAQGKGKVSATVLAQAQADAASASAKNEQALNSLAGQANTATQNLDTLAKAIEGFGSAQLDARSAVRAMDQAIADATAAIAKNGKGLDVTTQKGRDNQATLDAIASSTEQAAGKTLTLTHNTAKAAAVMQQGRDAFIEIARAAGLSAPKAKALADELGLIPKNVQTAIGVTGYSDSSTKIANAKKAAKDFANGDYQAALKADPADLKSKVADAQHRATAMAKANYTAFLKANPSSALNNTADAARKAHSYAAGAYTAAIRADAAQAVNAIDDAKARLRALNGMSATVYVKTAAANLGYNIGQPVQKAGGGSIDGPGPKGVDSVPVLAAPGEHMWTAREVDAAGGHTAMYRMRARALTGTLGKYAAGGAALRSAEERVAAAKKALAEAKTRAARHSAQNRLDSANQHLRDVKHDEHTAAAAKAVKASAAAKKARAQSRAALAQDREQYISGGRRGSYADPVAYIDELRSMSQDSTAFTSAAQRAKFDREANANEVAMIKLSKASTAAATKLTDLKASAQQLHDSVKSAITGGFSLSAAGQQQVASGWATQNGVRYRTYTTGTSASSIASYEAAGAAQAKTFAGQLKQLAAKGLNSNMLSEIAGYGTAQGSPIAAALLSAPASQLKAINANYSAISTYADQAGKTVADANYAKQIAAADKNAASINTQIAKKVDELKKIIGKGLHVKGYATGTMSAAPGLRMVGENGPELELSAGGERILNATSTQRWLRGGPPVLVKMPDTITVKDARGFTATMEVVAQAVVRAAHGRIAAEASGGHW